MNRIQMKKVLLWYPDPRNAPGLCAVVDFPRNRDSLLKQLHPNDYVDLTEEEAQICGGLYHSGRYELKLMIGEEEK